MDLRLPIDAAAAYKSGAQRARVITESWVKQWGYCPNCGSGLDQFTSNRPVADFHCQACPEEYELKASRTPWGNRIVDGAYDAMLRRLRAENNPNLLLLSYEWDAQRVKAFMAIPRSFFVPSIIEPRRALGESARRAGWQGWNILFTQVPELARIYLVHNSITQRKAAVLEQWRRTEFAKGVHGIDARGWLLDVLRCVEELHQRDFSLEDMYRFEQSLKAKHPQNNNVRAKIRQQLQVLRDRKLVTFGERGRYKTNF